MPPFVERFQDLLRRCVEIQASDLHLSAQGVPMVRIDGRLQPMNGAAVEHDDVERMARAVMQPQQAAVFDRDRTVDLAMSLPGGERFRVNIFQERSRMAMAVRRLEDRFRSLDDLRLPAQIGHLADLRDGLVLVTGPTGSGKTTTLAMLIHQINLQRACHIITVEDPIEYLHRNERSLIHQREVATDVPSFAAAVRAALREDPDVMLVGEMRDVSTMRAAITAAETGHLVFSTLHTGDAVGALERMVGAFPGDEQDAMRQQLSMTLRAVVAQRLLPCARGGGRVPVVEILMVTPAVAHLIRTGKSQQIYSLMETGTAEGMQTVEQALAQWVACRTVDIDTARPLARDRHVFEKRLAMLQSQTSPPGRGRA